MLSKAIVLCFCMHLINGQVPQGPSNGGGNPFVFDLPPLKLEPLQIRLNPLQSSPSIVLLNKNESIPIETLPSSTNPTVPTTQPQPQTQLQRPQVFTPFTSTAAQNPWPTGVAPAQLPTLLPLSFQPFTQLNVQQNQPKPSQSPEMTRSQIFRPFVFAPEAPQTFTFNPSANPFLTGSWKESPAQVTATSMRVQPNQNSILNSQSNDKNNVPKESSVNYASNLESILQDLSTYIPIQLPGQMVIFNHNQAQSAGQQLAQNDANTRFLPPVILPPVSLPAPDEVKMVEVSQQQQQQANLINQAQAEQQAQQAAQQVSSAPAPSTAAPQPAQTQTPAPVQSQQQAQVQTVQQVQTFQPLQFQQIPVQALNFVQLQPLQPLNPQPTQAPASSGATQAAAQPKPTFKPLSFRTAPFQTVSTQKKVSIPKVQALTPNNKPNSSNKMVSQHLSFGQSGQSGATNWAAKPTQ